MEISIIGGDLRTVKLIKLLAQDKNKIKAWGFENCEELLDFEKKNDNLKIHNNLDEALQNQIIIGPTKIHMYTLYKPKIRNTNTCQQN